MKIKFLQIRKTGRDGFDTVTISAAGKIDFSKKKIMGEFPFEEVDHFGIAIDEEDKESTILLIPNVPPNIPSLPLKMRNADSCYINCAPFLNDNNISYPSQVPWEIVPNVDIAGTKKPVIKLYVSKDETTNRGPVREEKSSLNSGGERTSYSVSGSVSTRRAPASTSKGGTTKGATKGKETGTVKRGPYKKKNAK